jgi:hypothetical protein
VPPRARAVVVVADGTGRARELPLAHTLHQASLATLVLDPVTADEVTSAIDWLALDAVVGDLPPRIGRLPVGCFAAGTGTVAALIAAAERPDRVAAVVAHDGLPGLTTDALARVTAPTLLIHASRELDLVAALARDWLVHHLVR